MDAVEICQTNFELEKEMPRRKTPKTKDSATQTDPHEPVVILNRLRDSFLGSLGLVRKTTVSPSSPSLSVQNASAIEGPNSEKPLRRLPRDYNFFVRPITNNSKASSTIAMAPEENQGKYESIKGTSKKKVQFMKPGPLSYKKRFLEKESRKHEDLNIPVMLDEPTSANNSSLFEHDSLNRTTEIRNFTPPLESSDGNNTTESAKQPPIKIHGNVIVNVQQAEVKTKVPSDRSKENLNRSILICSSDSPGSCKINNNYENDAEEDQTSTNNSGRKSEQARSPKGKTIVIKANNVFVHNHFYN